MPARTGSPPRRRPHRRLASLQRLLALATCLVPAPLAHAAPPTRAESAAPVETVVINARVFNGYQRTKLPDGTFKPERFAVVAAGQRKAAAVDPSIDDLPFQTIVRTIVPPLAAQNYLPTADARQTDLLLIIAWGRTDGARAGRYDHGRDALFDAMNAVQRAGENPTAAEDNTLASALLLQGMENRARDRNNFTNARILGYDDAYAHAHTLRDFGLSWGDTTVDELEDERYFVVLKACDFPSVAREKKLKLLWEARFSIRARGHRFDRQLLAMAQAAAKYFGHDTAGLLRRPTRDMKVELGPLEVIETDARLAPPTPR